MSQSPVTPPAVETEVAPIAGGASTALDDLKGHAGRAVATASLVKDTAQAIAALHDGNYQAAADHAKSASENAGIQLIQHQGTWKLIGKLAPELAETVSEKIPVIGAVVALGSGLWETGQAVRMAATGKASWRKAGITALADTGEVGGSILGFGLGEVLRQGVVEVSKRTAGVKDTPADAAAVTVGKELYSMAEPTVSHLLDKNDPAIVSARAMVHHDGGNAQVVMASYTPVPSGKPIQLADNRTH